MEEQLQSGKFVLTENGEEKEYTTLFTFYNDITQKNYVVYTDNTENDEGKQNVYASTYDSDNENSELEPVNTEEEWQNINELLFKLIQKTE